MTGAFERGEAALRDGRYQEAAAALAKAVRDAERRFGPRHLRLVAPIIRLGVSYRYLARFVEAGAQYQRALAILDAHRRVETDQGADVFHNLGGLEHAAGNWLRGEPFAREAVRLRTRLHGPRHPLVAVDLTALGALLDRQGKWRQAERLYRRAIGILDGDGDSRHHLAVTLNNLAALRHAHRAFAEAEGLYRRARDIEVETLGADHPAVAYSTNNLAVLMKDRGRLQEAAPLFRKALAIFTRRLGPRHPNVGVCLENYASVLRRQRRTVEARAALRKARDIFAAIEAVNEKSVAVTGTINPLFASYRLSVRASAIHRIGVFAEEGIPKGRKVIEYTGERITQAEGGRRWNTSRSYLFELNSRWHIDGAIGGSGAEYINHSCEPNLSTRILREHILYFSDRAIRKGEELTVDYHYDHDVDRLPCGCGAPSCRGTMNVLPPKTRAPKKASARPEPATKKRKTATR